MQKSPFWTRSNFPKRLLYVLLSEESAGHFKVGAVESAFVFAAAIYDVVMKSLYYIVDARADIEILLTFAAGVFAEKEIFQLFKIVH